MSKDKQRLLDYLEESMGSDSIEKFKLAINSMGSVSNENEVLSQLDSQYQTGPEVLLQLPFYPVGLIGLLYG